MGRKGKTHINFNELEEFDIRESTLAVRINLKGYKYLIPKTNKIKERRYDWYLLNPDRAPVQIGWGKHITMLLRKEVVNNYTINKKNEIEKLREYMKPNEVLIDWERGVYYHKTGHRLSQKFIEEYYLEFREVNPSGRGRKVDRKIPDANKEFKYTRRRLRS